MQLLLAQIYERLSLEFFIITLFVVIIIGGALWNYKSTGAFWTRRVKRAYFRFALMGMLPWLITGWLFLLEIGFTRELMVAFPYCTGIAIILVHRYVFVFLQELDKMPNYPRSEYQLQVFNEIKDHKILYFMITIYFFIMGTLALFAIIE